MYPEYKSANTKTKLCPFQCPKCLAVNAISNDLKANFNCTMTYMFSFLKDNYIGQENLTVMEITKKSFTINTL